MLLQTLRLSLLSIVVIACLLFINYPVQLNFMLQTQPAAPLGHSVKDHLGYRQRPSASRPCTDLSLHWRKLPWSALALTWVVTGL
jgi:hypothetical protein